MLEIVSAQTGENLREVRMVWREYGDFLKTCFAERSGVPAFQEYFRSYEEEITDRLPGSYTQPNGGLLLAKYQRKTAGCVGLRALDNGICEMKRLFVRPRYRGLGIGRALAEAIIDRGRNLGYTSMRLDTNHRMPEAVGLYRSLGFYEIAPYEHFDVEGMIYMELRLT